jgi:hypothetical protein
MTGRMLAEVAEVFAREARDASRATRFADAAHLSATCDALRDRSKALGFSGDPFDGRSDARVDTQGAPRAIPWGLHG